MRQREDILEAVAKVFARHGYHNTEMQSVAEALHAGKGTVYRYFRSKEELFLAAVEFGLCRLREAVDASCSASVSPLDRLALTLHSFLRFFQTHWEFAELLIQERAEFPDHSWPNGLSQRAAVHGRWIDIYRALQAQGKLRQDVPLERFVNVISDLLCGAVFANHFAAEPVPFERQARDILDIICHGILADQLPWDNVERKGCER